MINPNDIENEIDAIRDTIYKVTKEMSPQERVAYINLRAQEVLKRKLNHAENVMEPKSLYNMDM